MTREKELMCALIWLRNHYDYAAVSGGLKKNVIARIDRVLENNYPSISDMVEWREQCQKEESKADGGDSKSQGAQVER